MLEAPVLTGAEPCLVWIHSDLQLADPQTAEEVLTAAVDDVLSLGMDVGCVWCLGDALTGTSLGSLEKVAQVCIDQMARLAVPVCYVMGNHELDLRRTGERRLPLYERAAEHPQWHTMAGLEDFYFVRQIAGCPVVFMGDHLAEDGSWWTTHGQAHAAPGVEVQSVYPHSPQAYERLRQMMADHPGPVVTASHYAMPGGQRHSELMRSLLPLPANHRLHVYGHAHIGDLVWNKEHPWQRELPIEGLDRVQYNISALETARSPGSHSAFLEITPQTGPARLRIRCHQSRQWLESFTLGPRPEPSA